MNPMGKRSRDKGKKKRQAKRGRMNKSSAGLGGAFGRAKDDETPASSDSPRLVEATELAADLASLSTVLQRQLRRADHDDGLTRARLSALALLVLGGPRRLGELAAAEGVRPPTMTRLAHAMEADGLVARRPDASDGRSVIIAATPAGEQLLGVGRARQIRPLADAIEALDDEDAAVLAHAADVLSRLLRDADRSAERR